MTVLPGVRSRGTSSRGRRIGLAGVAAIGARVVTTGSLLIAIRVVSPELNPEQLGLFALVVGSQQLLAFADLGIGNGLVNVIAAAEARNRHDEVRSAVSSAVGVLTVIGLVAISIVLLVRRWVDWASVLGIESPAAEDASGAVSALIVLTAVNLPLAAAGNVYIARQRGWIPSACAAGGAVTALVGLALVTGPHTSLVVMVAVVLSGVPAGGLLCSLLLYRSEPNLCPRPSATARAVALSLLRRGGHFFVLAMAISVAYQSDAIILARSDSASAVTTFAVAARVFLVAPLVVTLAVTPLWPAHREAAMQGDVVWVVTALRRSVVAAALVTAVVSLGLLFMARPIIGYLVIDGERPPWSLLLALGAWAVVNAVSAAVAAFLNGVGALRIQTKLSIAMAAANIGLSILLVGPLGATGPVLASVVTQCCLVLGPLSWSMRGLLAANPETESLDRWVERHGDIIESRTPTITA